MKIRLLTIIILLVLPASAICQNADLNKTDAQGRKQGHWIKKYPGGTIQYEGNFRDNHPVGEFRRFYENTILMSLMVYSDDGREVEATLYHPNGFIASQGKYINQRKEGLWKFYSHMEKDYLVAEELYSGNLRNGLSVRYYPDHTIAEKISYVNDRKEGEWLQFHENGKPLLKAMYSSNMLNGSFETWFSDGRPQITGVYKNNLREGRWSFFNYDGSIRYVVNYKAGIGDNRQMDIDASKLMDSLDLNKDNIQDPEKTDIYR